MFLRNTMVAVTAALTLCLMSGRSVLAPAQETKKDTPPTPGPAQSAADEDAAARKAAILDSPEWRRAMFEFKEWLSAQQIYDPQQVADLKNRFNHRVAAMSASELEFLLADMEAKFKILNSPQAEEARSWMAQYLSVLSDKKRAEVLKDIPNVATMTAAQLEQEIMKIEAKRNTLIDEQKNFQRSQDALVSQQLAQDRAARQTYIREREQFPTTSYSPYRSGSDVNERLNTARVGGGMSYYVGPWGGVGISFSPSSW